MKRSIQLITVLLFSSIVLALLSYAVPTVLWPGDRLNISEVHAAIDAYDFTRAAELLAESDSATAELLKAECARRRFRQDFANAHEHLGRALKQGMDAERVEFEFLLLKCQQFGLTPAFEHRLFELVRSSPPDAPRIYEAMVRGYLRIRHFHGALECLDRWIGEFPNDWRGRMWRGACFEHLAKPELAIEDYQSVVRQRPDDLVARRRLGLVLAKTGYDIRLALECLSSVEEPDHPDILVAKALCLRALGESARSREYVETALVLDKDHYRGLQLLALLELNAGRNKHALELVNQLERLEGRVDPATSLRRLLELNPVAYQSYDTQIRGQTLYLKSTALRRMGQLQAAQKYGQQLIHLQETAAQIKRLLRQIEGTPAEIETAYRLGVLYAEIDFHRDAKNWFADVLERQPGHTEARKALNLLQQNSRNSTRDEGQTE